MSARDGGAISCELIFVVILRGARNISINTADRKQLANGKMNSSKPLNTTHHISTAILF